jgi:hypothetical protein
VQALPSRKLSPRLDPSLSFFRFSLASIAQIAPGQAFCGFCPTWIPSVWTLLGALRGPGGLRKEDKSRVLTCGRCRGCRRVGDVTDRGTSRSVLSCSCLVLSLGSILLLLFQFCVPSRLPLRVSATAWLLCSSHTGHEDNYYNYDSDDHDTDTDNPQWHLTATQRSSPLLAQLDHNALSRRRRNSTKRASTSKPRRSPRNMAATRTKRNNTS